MRSWRRALLLAGTLLGGLAPGWAQGAAPPPVVTDVKVKDIGSTSVTVTFSSGTPAFGGVSYQPSHGASTTWTTVNEAYAVDHSVAITGLKPATQYTFQAWASGATNKPTSTFQTSPTTAAVIHTQIQALGQDAAVAGGGNHFWAIAGGSLLLLILLGGVVLRMRRPAPAPIRRPVATAARPAAAVAAPTRALPPSPVAAPVPSALYSRRLLDTAKGGPRLAVEVDAELLQKAQVCTGVTDTAALVAGALEALIYLETSRHAEAVPVLEPEPEGVPREG